MAASGHHPLPAPPPHQEGRHDQQQYQQPQQYQPVQQQQQQHQQQYQTPPQQYSPQRQQPQQQQYAVQTPAVPAPVQKPGYKSRSFSFRSDKSHKSSGSHPKIDLSETSAEKESKRLHSKADPTLAMNEAEPSAVQANSKALLAPLRAIQHRDSSGNPIAEPDKSNPTRSRWERPLDTIRSFEAAIDGGYQRKSYIRSDSESVAWNRRSSYYGNHAPRFPNDSYYARPQSFRPESTPYEGRPHMLQHRESYAEPGYGPGPSRQRAPRMHSEPQMNGYGRSDYQQAVYPIPHKDRSYETVTSAAASGSSGDHNGYHTDPTSSENSSIDRASPGKRPEPSNDYGIGFSQNSGYKPPAFNFNTGRPQPPPHHTNGLGNGIPPRVPVHGQPSAGGPPPLPRKGSQSLLRRALPQQLQQPPQQQAPPAERPGMGDKRKSWFSRRFSKAL